MPETTWRGLTIYRPWSTLIANGSKTVENRSWPTKYRGLVLIHGGVAFDQMAPTHAATLGVPVSDKSADHPQGVVGVAKLVDVCSTTVGSSMVCDCGPWAIRGQHHWRLANPRALATPVPCVGKQGLWIPRPEVVDAVRAQLAGGAR